MAQPSSINPYLPEKGDKSGFSKGFNSKKEEKTSFLTFFGRLKPGVKAGIFAVVIGIVGFSLFNYANESNSMVLSNQGETEALDDSETEATGETISIHIDGAVVQPGVYDIKTKDGSELRVRDAVDAARGLTEEANVSSINLAAKIEDGQKIHIPKVGEVAVDANSASARETSGASSGQDSKSGLVNINTATEKDLETLPGIGEATAKAIVEDRRENGSFKTIDDLMRVSGIGEKKFEKIKGKICV